MTDTERSAPTFTAYDLDVHLAPAQASLAVQARLNLRNDGAQPLARLALQLSSTLHIERVSLAGAGQPLSGASLPITHHLAPSDADHTGQLEETVITLPQPLAPGASLTLSVAYRGTIEPNTARLDQLETPAAVATSADWDRISPDFTGLRGFGDVVWYPVCSVPAMLGDGARLFTEIGRQRARNQDATIAILVTEEFTGETPSIAVLAGHVIEPGAPQEKPSASFPGVLHFALPATRLGFRTPSLFVADRVPSAMAAGPVANLIRTYSMPAHTADAASYASAAPALEPLLNNWLGTRSRQRLAVIDLPVANAQPSEQGDSVFVSMADSPTDPADLSPLLAQELAHASFHSPRVWLDEGVPALLGNLYLEQAKGGDTALQRLGSARDALAFAEPASPGSGAGQDLLHASDPIYYRGKSLYVLWMLRDLAGDKAMEAAFHAYDGAADTDPAYFEKLVEQASGKDLKWFFDAWVYRDMGLPDLSIVNVFSSRSAQADQWLVSIDIANDGYCEAEVPVTVHSAGTAVTERVRIGGRTKVSRRMLIVGEPTSVDVNDGTVPEVQASIHQRLLKAQ